MLDDINRHNQDLKKTITLKIRPTPNEIYNRSKIEGIHCTCQ